MREQHLDEQHELRAALREVTGLCAAVFGFSALVNLLIFTGPLYMMQVYDRVLAAHSVETLLALSVIALVMFVFIGLFDAIRGLVLLRIGARMQKRLDARVMVAALRRLEQTPGAAEGLAAEQDVEALHRLIASPVVVALCDVVWAPLFLAALFVFDAALGWLALGGGGFLVLLALMAGWLAREPLSVAAPPAAAAARLAAQMRVDPSGLRATGLSAGVLRLWTDHSMSALSFRVTAMDRTAMVGAATRALRMALQSAVLGLGALLVLRDELGAGALFAASVMTGRALAPVEIAISQWTMVTRALEAWQRLARLLESAPDISPRLPLPRPEARLEVRGLRARPPGATRPTLWIDRLELRPGQVLGVIGPSGSGKSTFARAVAAVWPPQAGSIRLGGAKLPLQDDTAVGYLPQTIFLIEGTVAQNIARFAPEPDHGAIIAAARNAGAHEMILGLPQGYDTRLAFGGAPLSGGQAQRISLARAMFGNPVMLVLDEPHAHLDHAGAEALAQTLRHVRAGGGIAVITAHRPVALALCDLILVLDEGRVRAFGPRDQVLRAMLQSSANTTLRAVATAARA
ncbi:MAG: type I secretion system permease/ATPase [Cereibacter sphaeroides]|uniref:Type I secretion system permease/ATPase n=1 Tax=Cereibacter sphaeroides TaxID=1063 RepID=A0A2W5S6L6_CERSP|nr:MAG: type I secretion system permease/ATPase [Cereibacter sphaeroides]